MNDKSYYVGLELFVAMWQQAQQQNMPQHHLQISQWLQRYLHRGQARLLLLAFRGSGKSTLTALCIAWILWRNPEARILILAAEQGLAEQLVVHVRGIIEQHPLTDYIRPHQKTDWARDRLVVKRNYASRDPSLKAAGITANITGTRANLIICDDVEVPNTTATPELRRQLQQRLQELDFILTPQGSVLYLGTPHAVESLYDAGNQQSPLQKYQRLVVPAIDGAGQPVWPQRFNLSYLEKLKKQVGPLAFAQHMQLQTKALKSYYFNPQQVQWYDGMLDYNEAQGTPVLSLLGHKIVSVQCWWDPAFANDKLKGGDNSVVACIYRDHANHIWLHGVHYIKTNNSSQIDNATQQAQAVVAFLQQHYAPKILIEMNGIGQFLPDILRRELAAAKVPCSVVASHTHRAKNARIIEAFDALLAAQRLHVHASIKQTPWWQEFIQWRPTKQNQKDDGLDAVAGAILADPVRLTAWPRLLPSVNEWRPHAKSFVAQTD